MKNRKYDKSTLRWIYTTSKKYHPHIVLLIVCNGVFSVISIIFALFCRGIIDSATAGNKETVIHNGIGLFAVIAAMLIIRLMCNNLNEIIHAGLEKEYKSRILSLLLKKSFKSTSTYHSGELLNRMFSDVSVVSDGVTALLPNLVGLITRLIAAAAVLMTLDLQFTLLFIIAGLIVFTVSRFLRGKIKQLHKEVQETQGAVRSFLQETLEGLMVIKIF
ncbi:MAG: ABC transporter ATP-binding protein, partial [Ruminiclostridium sp.]|nr:ABC transporter ATP-binding protein [Ruminiclostridium sp.]